MFGKDIWRIIRLIYIILKALIRMDGSNGDHLDDLES